jgi:glycosyltransferase involved in cell wall biosynthesis
MTESFETTAFRKAARPQRPLRVCHLAYTFYERDTRVIRYVEACLERGDEVDVIALRQPDQSRVTDSGGARVFHVQRRSITEKGAWAYLLKILWFCIKSTRLLTVMQLRRRYDVVHVHNVPDFLVFAAWLPKLMGARVILDIHDILPELYAGKFGSAAGSRMFKWLLIVERQSCRFSDHVITANHLWHDRVVGRAVPADRCTPILNYPDLKVFKPLPDQEGRAKGPFLMLYPGSLNHHQGLDIAIKAFALVHDRMPDAEFHIYGEGPARPGLEQLTQECGLTGRVRFMAHVPLGEVSALMASASVGVVPKRADGFGNEAFSTKTLEFMACGVPVVVARTRVDAHYFNDSLVRFFTPGEPADLARVLLDMYDNRWHQAALIHAAREFAVVNSWQERIGDYLGIVDSLAAAPQPEALAG